MYYFHKKTLEKNSKSDGSEKSHGTRVLSRRAEIAVLVNLLVLIFNITTAENNKAGPVNVIGCNGGELF